MKTPRLVVQEFWDRMGTNDFRSASELLAVDYECYWPQSNELICGPSNFAELNENYPASGKWRFSIIRIVAEGDQVVSEVAITDGSVSATAVTFHTVENELISKQVEYWPDPYPAPEWRSSWVKLMSKSDRYDT